MLAAGLAVLLLAGGAAWWWVTWDTGSFQSGDRVFVADFKNPSGQPMFETAVRDAFEDMLGVSRFLEVVPRDRVQDLTGPDAAGHTRQIDQELATQICGEGSWAGYLTGEIAPEGGGYRIVATLHHCGRREPLINGAAVAREEGEVLMVIHEIAIGIRKTLGEVPDAISATTPPTTRSLPAYQALVLARRVGAQGRGREAIALGQRALKIDPDFVDAYSDLALNYSSLFKWKEYRRFAEEAFRRSADLPEPIRLTNELQFLDAWYEFDEEVAKLKQYLALYPHSPDKANWLAFTQLWRLADPAAAETAFRAAYDISRDVDNLLFLAQCLAFQGKLAELEALVEEHRRNGGTVEECDAAMLFLYLGRGNFDKIRENVKRLELDLGSVGYWALASRLWGALAAGRLQEVEAFSVSAWRRGEENQENALQTLAGLSQGWLEARRSGKSLRLTPGSLRPMRNRLLALGNLATFSVDVGLAEPLSQEIQKHQVTEKGSKSRFVREALEFGQASLALIQGKSEAAIEILEPIARNSIMDQHHHVLAKAYEAAGKWRRAAAQYERMLGQPYRKFLFYNPAEWVLDQFRLARIYERLGDNDRARHWYEQFLTDWKNADPGIPELIDAEKRLSVLTASKPVTR